jgi:hypothetical protein
MMWHKVGIYMRPQPLTRPRLFTHWFHALEVNGPAPDNLNACAHHQSISHALSTSSNAGKFSYSLSGWAITCAKSTL